MVTRLTDAGPMPPLTNDERAALSAACDALFPARTVPGDKDPIDCGALSLSVPARIEETMTAMAERQRAELRLLLRMLEQPGLMIVLAGRARRFSQLDADTRGKVLRRMSTSPVPQLRTAFQALLRLSAFHQYSERPNGADNPLWSSLGYEASSNPPAARSLLRLRQVQGAERLECDVCVVGSGAGGSVIAGELAARGRTVLILEAGSDWQCEEFDQHESAGTRELYLDRGTTTTGDLSVAFLAGSSLGGGTTVNWQSCFRTPDAVLEEWAARSGCAHFTGDTFGRSLDNVWGRLAVSRDESIVNANNAVLERGSRALGYNCARIARNSLGCDTSQCGYCVFGCRHGSKRTGAATFLRDAQKTGNLSVIARCTADRVIIENGKVTGVMATATDSQSGGTHAVRVFTGVVVAACGALNTPALLVRSGVTHPRVGRNLFIHPTTAMTGVFDELIEPWKGPPQTIVCDEFAGARGTHGYRIETAPVHPGLLAMATPWLGAHDHLRSMEKSAHRSVLIVLVRDRSTGRVTVGRDGRPSIRYTPGSQERQLLRRGMASAARILHAAGATEVQSLHARPLFMKAGSATAAQSPAAIDRFCAKLASSPTGENFLQLFSAHQMGTCAMGSDPHRAVCDGSGQVFGVRGLYIGDGSAFPASSGVNPMITIMAMAHHTARQMSEKAFG